MALFEGIKVEDLLDHQPENDESRIFRIVAERLDEPLDVVERIGNAILGEYKNHRGRTVRRIRCRQVIEDDDRRYLQRVKEICAEIYGYDDRRPGKVTVKTVSRALGLDFYKLKKMRSCIKEIERNYETQEHYWAREVIWAVGQIRANNETMNFIHIRKYTNMTRENLTDSLQELRDQDEEVYGIVKGILKY